MENQFGVTSDKEPEFTESPDVPIEDGSIAWKYAGKPDEFAARVAEVLTAEMEEPEQWFYLSFADNARGGFLGAVVVKAHGPADAVIKVGALGANPGGEVLCVPLPPERTPDDKFCNRLLSKPEIEAMWGEPCKSIREWDEEAG